MQSNSFMLVICNTAFIRAFSSMITWNYIIKSIQLHTNILSSSLQNMKSDHMLQRTRLNKLLCFFCANSIFLLNSRAKMSIHMKKYKNLKAIMMVKNNYKCKKEEIIKKFIIFLYKHRMQQSSHKLNSNIKNFIFFYVISIKRENFCHLFITHIIYIIQNILDVRSGCIYSILL